MKPGKKLLKAIEENTSLHHIGMGMYIKTHSSAYVFECRQKMNEPLPGSEYGFISEHLKWFTIIMN